MGAFFTSAGLLALVTLTFLEIVLGVDNVIFISILFAKLPQSGISGRDMILIGGGLFLLAKATLEIHERLEGEDGQKHTQAAPSFGAVIFQIMLLDIVFSLDSVITAVGMADDLSIMIAAVVLAVGVMMFSAEPISAFVNHHPTIKVLALSFLLLIGISLIGDGLGMHVPKGYIYFAMGFSVFVEMINLRVRAKRAA
jgi:predicted tellurium resistance membrane protein TerC